VFCGLRGQDHALALWQDDRAVRPGITVLAKATLLEPAFELPGRWENGRSAGSIAV
jgi:hypothetical protein